MDTWFTMLVWGFKNNCQISMETEGALLGAKLKIVCTQNSVCSLEKAKVTHFLIMKKKIIKMLH